MRVSPLYANMESFYRDTRSETSELYSQMVSMRDEIAMLKKLLVQKGVLRNEWEGYIELSENEGERVR